MSAEINIIKPALLLLFNEGKTEVEAYADISKSHSSYSISLKLVNFWFKKFRSGDDNLGDKNKPGRKPKFTNEFLINLIKANPELSIAELAKIIEVSSDTVSKRLRKINNNGERTIYKYKTNLRDRKKLTDEFLINLINDYPDLNVVGIAKLAKYSHTAVYRRISKINSKVPGEYKIILPKYKDKLKKSNTKITDEYLIDLVNENPELNISQLAKLADSSSSVISTRLKKINSDGNKVLYKSKKSKDGTTKLTQESLIKLIRENPGLKPAELAELADTSVSTLIFRLKQVNKNLPTDQIITLKADKIKRNKSKNIVTEEEIIKLVNENPELTVRELSKLSNIPHSTLSLRLKKINSEVKLVNYTDKKSLNGTKKLTDEFLINLINENPKLNMSELAKIANTSQPTISRKLKKINNYSEKVKYMYRK